LLSSRSFLPPSFHPSSSLPPLLLLQMLRLLLLLREMDKAAHQVLLQEGQRLGTR